MIRSILALMTIATLAACQTTVNPSESYYTSAETMRSSSVNRCRVLETRQVTIGAQSSGSSYSTSEQQLGALVGAALGAAVGSQIGAGDGQTIAMAIGATAGAAVGTAQGTRMAQKTGIEYSVLTAQGKEEVIVQYYNSGDRIVQAGSTCRISGTGNNKRVLPAEQLPTSISRPLETRFSN